MMMDDIIFYKRNGDIRTLVDKGNGFGRICNTDKNSRKLILRYDDMVRNAFQATFSENYEKWK